MIVYLWVGLMIAAVLVIFGCLFYFALVIVDKILDISESINIIIDDIINWWKGEEK